MTEQLQVTETIAKEISRELKDVWGIKASPEAVKAFSLGLGLRGEWVHSKKEIIDKFLTAIHQDIRSQKNFYESYVTSGRKMKIPEIPKFMKC